MNMGRRRLKSFSGCKRPDASHFAAGNMTPPLIVQAPGTGPTSGQLFTLLPEGAAEAHFRPASDGRGLIVNLRSLSLETREISLGLPARKLKAAFACSPLEVDTDALPVANDLAVLSLAPRTISTVRLIPD
jgi:hypothetical protein